MKLKGDVFIMSYDPEEDRRDPEYDGRHGRYVDWSDPDDYEKSYGDEWEKMSPLEQENHLKDLNDNNDDKDIAGLRNIKYGFFDGDIDDVVEELLIDGITAEDIDEIYEHGTGEIVPQYIYEEYGEDIQKEAEKAAYKEIISRLSANNKRK